MLFVTNLEPGTTADDVHAELVRLLNAPIDVQIDSNEVAWVTFEPNHYTNLLVNTIRLNGRFQVTRPLMWTWTIRENADMTTDQVKQVAAQDHQLHLLRFT